MQRDLFAATEAVGKRKTGSTSRPTYRAESLSHLTEQRTLTSTRVKVRENRRGTLKRMPGGVGGTAAKAAYLSRLEKMA